MATYAQATPKSPPNYVCVDGQPIKQNSTVGHYKAAVPPTGSNASGNGITTGHPISG